MEISEIKDFTENYFQQLRLLMQVLNDSIPFNKEKLDNVIQDSNSHLFVLKNKEEIIGCYTICLFHSPTGRKASIEDVVISPSYQGRHLGRKLIEHAISQLREYAPVQVQLTSRPSRIAANALYSSAGFTHKDTNVYVLHID